MSANMTKQCKCEHWQECPTCQPRRFDADGNRLPPEPTPLQAARAQIEKDTALLRQALEALEQAHDESLNENHFECRQILIGQITALRAAIAKAEGRA